MLRWTAARKLRAVFSIARGHWAPKLFDLGEEVLDQMARCIEFSIIVTLRGPISSPCPTTGVLPTATSCASNTRASVSQCRCLRSAYRPASWSAGDPLPPDRVPRRRSGESGAGCLVTIFQGCGFWCSVHRANGRSPGPRRLFLRAGAMLMGAQRCCPSSRIRCRHLRRDAGISAPTHQFWPNG